MDTQNIYNNTPKKSENIKNLHRNRNSIIDNINTQSNEDDLNCKSDIDVLPTPVLYIPKRQSKVYNITEKSTDSKEARSTSIVFDNKLPFFNNITNTINTKLDSHPTIHYKGGSNSQRTLSIIESNSSEIYDKKRHISAPITARKLSNAVAAVANSNDSSRIYNSESHYSPTNETNQNLALMNKQYLEYVENDNIISEANISITELVLNGDNKVSTYKKENIIGSGNFSDVYQFKRLHDSKLFACKYIKYPIDLLKLLKRDKKKAQEMLLQLESSLLREIKILQHINILRQSTNEAVKIGSQNIIQLVGVNNEEILKNDSYIQTFLKETFKLPECYIVTDLCSGGNLLHLLKDYKMSIQMIQEIFCQVFLSLKFLHNNNIIHRDVKLENILLTIPSADILHYFEKGIPIPNTLVKLSDFGLSKQIDPENPLSSARCGSPDYIPPEILLALEYDGRLTDIWSFGVCLYAALEEMLPFDSNAVLDRQKEIALKQGKMIVQKRRGMSDSMRISRCDWKWYYMAELGSDVYDEDKKLYEQCKEVVEKCLVRRTDRFNTIQLNDMDFFKLIY
ncbi:hypothetical protein QEN19_002439 [Hanseniaspora menglaensis]